MSPKRTLKLSLPLLLTTGLAGSALAVGSHEDEHSWPQWDGPQRDTIAHETDWLPEGRALWDKEVGLGYSTVSLQGGQLYTMGYDEEAGLDVVWCLDPLTGEELWAHVYPSKIWNQAHRGGTVNTPSVDPSGEVVYSLNREGNLFALDTETGEVIWHRNVKEEHDLTYPTWGFSASPLLIGDEMILNCGKVLSIDKETGDLKWATKDYGHAYGTAAAFELEGTSAAAVLNGSGTAVVSIADGKELYFFEFGGQSRGVNAATPVVIDDAMFISSGPRGGGALLAFGDGELIPVWENRNMANSFSGCVRLEDHLYGFDGSVLKCIDLEGQTTWEERGIGNGAVLGTPDRIVLMSSRGELIVAEATGAEYNELSRIKLFESGSFWTRPILVNGVIYCRSSDGQLVARDHRPAKD